DADIEKSGRCERVPQLGVEGLTGGLELLMALVFREDVPRELSERTLRVVVGEVHRGSPSPCVAMIIRWISFTPPPNVLISAERYACSSTPFSTAPGCPLLM